jgi:hypothetical protein
MPPVGFKPTILAGERAQTYTLDSAALGTGTKYVLSDKKNNLAEEFGTYGVKERWI